ncbi:MAG: S-layer homology domain-containing protein [Ruminococcaceae bacterium]|nr:S-layer homology domain-containing protein [Oscillospiraceae bacterium]
MAKPATCTEDGNTAYYICSCGKMFTTKMGTSEITDLNSVVISATGHNYKWVIDKAATATEDGSKHEECVNCQHKKASVEIPAVGSDHVHSYSAVVVAPTCTKWGYTEHMCSCGEAYRDTYVKPVGHADADSDGFCDVCFEKLHTGGGIIVIPTYYDITVEAAAHGKVASSRKTASGGTTVTLTVEADKGYTLETLTVTDKDGNKIALTNKGNGEYTFKMPASDVTVEAAFMEDNTMLNYFVDVPTDAYYYDAVLWAVENEITKGTDAVHFSPDMTCTRAQAVTFLWRAAGSPEPETDVMPFVDVAAGSYYYDAVLWAVENGITKGTSDTTFSPDADCTRAQIVTFLWRAQKSPEVIGANPFTDVAADAYYVDAVLWAVEEKVTNGTSATTFSPDADCTRAQIVTFLYRALNDK